MLKAVIFDFDGVIANTEPVHFEAFRIILNEEGILLTEAEYYSRYLAYDDRTLFKTLLEDRGVSGRDDYIYGLMRRKSAHYDRLIEGNVEILPGVLQFIETLKGRVSLAIASGALKKEIMEILELAGIEDDFQAVVSAEDVERSKPEPDVYLETLRRLNSEAGPDTHILPSECVVIEDSVAGIRAAKAAGMRCLAVTNSYAAHELSGADIVRDTLSGLEYEDIAGI